MGSCLTQKIYFLTSKHRKQKLNWSIISNQVTFFIIPQTDEITNNITQSQESSETIHLALHEEKHNKDSSI